MLTLNARTMTALFALFSLASAPALAAEMTEQTPGDTIVVTGRFLSIDQLNAVKTPTPILNVPQSLSIITRAQLEDQAFSSVGDILRYTPGLSVSQGEGHRDAIIIRGNQSTADFFLDGLRDDVQYYRPLYNLEQVEILRGSNALLFGRGGGGGVINRVTKTAQLDDDFGGVSASLDTFGGYQLTGDVNTVLSDGVAFRVNAYGEHMESHRDVFEGERFAINPTFTVDLGAQTQAVLSYEYMSDDRVVDRGVPSVELANGREVPLEGYRDTFFGDPDVNNTTLEASIFRGRLEHTFSDALRGNITVQYADYDKLYQNIYPAGYDSASNLVTLDGYRDPTSRENLIIQGNLVGEFATGPFQHTVLVGAEYGDQSTTNARQDTLFAATGSDRDEVSLSDPIIVPDFTFGATVRDRSSDVEFASVYIQDQIDITDQFKLVLGGRYDRFDVAVLDRLAVSPTDDGRRGRVDEEFSPRLGAIYKPAETISIYASYAETFLPSSGDQFLTLSTTTENIEPQRFENTELGLKWDFAERLSLTTALFRLERGQFTSVDPNDPSTVTLVAGSVTEGFEVQLAGQLTDAWTLNAGYSYLDSEVDEPGKSNDGNRTRQTPEHMLSIWNEYQATDQLALALGVTYQDSYFVREDNTVEVPAYTRVDAAVFYDLTDQTRLQLNIENLLDEDYFPDAHSNDNISTGKPLNARITIRHQF